MRFAQRLRTIFISLVLCASLRAADAPDFLFVIDLSPAMAPRRDATLRTVGDLIRTGFHERIRPGQTFALWLNGQTLQTNPPIAWDAARAPELAQGALLQIPKEPSKSTSLLAGLAPMGDMTTFILTDGATPAAGTPFDAEINGEMAPRRDRFARAAKPFLVTLLARRGEWITFGVHTQIGAVVELPIASDPALMAEAVNRVRAADAPKTDNPVASLALAQSPRPLAAPIAEKTEPASKPVARAAEPPPIQQPPPQKTSAPTPAPKVEPVVVAEPKLVEIEPAPAPPPAAAVAKNNESTPKEEPPTAAAAAAPIVAVPVEPIASPEMATASNAIPPPAMTAPGSAPQSMPIAPDATATPAAFPWPFLLAIFAVIGAAGWLAYRKLMPAPRPKMAAPGSLISQSLPEPKPSKVIGKR